MRLIKSQECGKQVQATDEWHRIWNVLKWEMFEQGENHYVRVLPGITGMWQVTVRNQSEFSERPYWDEYSVRNWSMRSPLLSATVGGQKDTEPSRSMPLGYGKTQTNTERAGTTEKHGQTRGHGRTRKGTEGNRSHGITRKKSVKFCVIQWQVVVRREGAY
jgi:hypothetical protein